MSSEALKEQMLLYVIDALDDEERCEVERRLDIGCPVAIGALAEARAVIQKVPHELQPIAPPDNARTRLHRRLESHRTVQVPLASPERSRPREAPGTSTGTSPDPAKTYRHSMALAAAVAMALTAIALAFYALPTIGDQRIQLGELQQIVGQLKGDVDSYLEDLGRLRERDEVRQTMTEVLSSPALRVASLRVLENGEGDGFGWFYWDPESNRCQIFASHFDRAEGGRFHLSLLTDDEEEFSAATFSIDDSGFSSFALSMPDEGDRESPRQFSRVRVLYDDSEDGESDDAHRRPTLGGQLR